MCYSFVAGIQMPSSILCFLLQDICIFKNTIFLKKQYFSECKCKFLYSASILIQWWALCGVQMCDDHNHLLTELWNSPVMSGGLLSLHDHAILPIFLFIINVFLTGQVVLLCSPNKWTFKLNVEKTSARLCSPVMPCQEHIKNIYISRYITGATGADTTTQEQTGSSIQGAGRLVIEQSRVQ